MRTMLAGLVLITATTAHAAPRTRDAIAAVVAPHHDALRACYEAARAKTPKLEGTFVYTLNIGADGKVTKPVAKAPTPASKALDACVTKELGTLAFGAGDATVINYPFVFKPEDEIGRAHV